MGSSLPAVFEVPALPLFRARGNGVGAENSRSSDVVHIFEVIVQSRVRYLIYI